VVGSATLPAGVWKVKIYGLDLSNLNFWFADTCATRPARDPNPGESPDEVPRVPACPDESTYLLGDFVWADTANPGTLDPGEAGIPGVLMELVRPSDGAVIGTVKTGDTTSPNWSACKANNTGTDTNGLYCFGMDGPGTYKVRVAASNFDPGQPLAGKSSTTGGDSLTRTLSTSNVLTYDFGYNTAPPSTSPGTGTIGYWKTHPEAWPVQSITLGNVTYTKTQAIALLNTPSRGDKSIDLAKQLIGAKLNVLVGNAASCISATITAADAWLILHPVGSHVSGSSAAWTTGGGGVLHDTLDNYNNGRLCAPHRN